MKEEVFSINYSRSHQLKFIEEIKKGKLEEAMRTIESFPLAESQEGAVQRLTVIAQGYRTIIREYRARLETTKKSLENEKNNNDRERNYLVDQANRI